MEEVSQKGTLESSTSVVKGSWEEVHRVNKDRLNYRPTSLQENQGRRQPGRALLRTNFKL